MTYFKWSVADVVPTEDYKLILTFKSGEKRFFDAKKILDEPYNEILRNPSFFLKAHANCGSVSWNDEIDIAPEYLYEESIPVNE